jgi:hypothetical protein
MFRTHLGESHRVCIHRSSIRFPGGADPDCIPFLGSVHPCGDSHCCVGRLAWESATGEKTCAATTTLRDVGRQHAYFNAHLEDRDRISRDSLSDHSRTCSLSVVRVWWGEIPLWSQGLPPPGHCLLTR